MFARRRFGYRAGGFTFVELLAVIVIASMLAAAGFGVFMKNSRRHQLVETSRSLVRACAVARQVAIRTQQPCHVVLDREQQRVMLAQSGFDEDGVGYFVVRTRLFEPYTLPESISWEGGTLGEEQGYLDYDGSDNSVTFLPDGSADAALIRLTDDGHAFTVSVIGPTGRVYLERGDEAHVLAVEDLDL